MKISIVFSSKTGNTAMLAERIREILPKESCIYSGLPDEKALEADFIFAGFWTDKGTCDETMAMFLEKLRDKRVFLFGTAGFGGGEEYFARILSRVQTYLQPSNTVEGSFMCMGKMPMSVRKRYATMQDVEPQKRQSMIDNFDRALSHPDAADLETLEQAVRQI